MTTVTEELTLGVDCKSTLKYIYAKRGDRESRFIRVRLTSGGATIPLGTGATAKIRALLPNGTTAAENATINNDNTITAELSDNILAVKGVAKSDIAVYGASGQVLSSEVFCIKVQDAPNL